MKLEQQVVSLELAKKLKELGVKQESLYCWAQPSPAGAEWFNRGREHRLIECQGKLINWKAVSTFTVAELGEMLPANIVWTSRDGNKWSCLYEQNLQEGHSEFSTTEADARAKMLIYLIENRLVEV